jgi:hypothetical protein
MEGKVFRDKTKVTRRPDLAGTHLFLSHCPGLVWASTGTQKCPDFLLWHNGIVFLKWPIFLLTFLHLRMKKCKYMFVWEQCEGSTTMSKVYPVTSRFILDQRIVACKGIENCFHSCAAFFTGI